MAEQFLSPLEVAEILQIKKNTVYEMIKRGDIKAVKMGKQYRIDRKDVYAYMGVDPDAEGELGIAVCGQDMILDTLCELFNQSRTDQSYAYRIRKGSYNAIHEMYLKDNYVATCHMWDGETDTYNIPYITKILPGEQIAVFHLLKRWQGLYVQEGNPKKLQTFEDLFREDVRFINREKGSGIRIFVDEMLKKLGVFSDKIQGYEDEAASHMMAATAVKRGSADAAIGNEKTAKQVGGVGFIPLKQESYDIVFRLSDLEKEPYQALLACIRSQEFEEVIRAVEGYDTTKIGEQLY